MNSFLLSLAGLCVLALSALFAAPYFVDWNDYRDVFEAQATKLVGRDVDVGGDVSLTLLPAPVLRFETVNVADAKGGFDTPFASARSVTVWLSVPPLLRGTVEARSIEVVQPVVNLRIKKDGTGNWSDLGGEAAELPFIPRDVALNSVAISDATLNIWRDKPEPDTVVDKVAGELSSRGLGGPYKFNGQFSLAGKQRELRLTTGKPKETGEFRLNIGVKSPETKDTFLFEGVVRGLSAIPIFKGTLKAKLADKGVMPKVADADKAADADRTAEGDKNVEAEKKTADAPAPFEIKSDLYAALTGAQFENFELAINRNNKPQTIKGLMDMKFEKGLVVAGTFSSRWVDIDSWFSDRDSEPKTFQAALSSLAGEVLDRTSSVRDGSITLLFDQAVFAGDLSTNVNSNIQIEEGKLKIADLSVRLPGDNRLKLSGVLARDEQGVGFEGPVSLTGDSLSRLLRWAGMETDADLVAQQGNFAIAGKLAVLPRKFSLGEMEGDLFGSAFKGDLAYETGDQNTLSVSLQSDRMDLARVLGSKASARALLTALKGNSGEQGDAAGGSGLAGWLGKTHADADINIAAVTLAGLGETAAEMKVAFDQSSLDIKHLQLTSGTDATIQAGGRLAGLDGTPQGNITLAVQANNAKGVVAMGEFFELPALADRTPERVAALTPILLTAAVKSAEQEAPGLDVKLEGTMGKSDVVLNMDMQGLPSAWREAKLALQASLSNKNGKELLQQLRPGLTSAALEDFSAGPGAISLETNGTPAKGLDTKLVLGSGGTNASMKGKFTVGESMSRFSGSTSLTARNTRAGLALLGVQIPEAHGTDVMQASADLEWADSVYEFKNIKGELGGSVFEGDIRADRSKERPRIAATVRAAEASLPRLIAPVLGWNADHARSQEIRGLSDPGMYWPEVPFNARFLDSVDGSLSLQADALRISGPLIFRSASLQANLSDGKLSVPSLKGKAFGGETSLSGSLQARGAGAALEMKGEGSGISLAEISRNGAGKTLLDAPADIKFTVSGEGLTPLGLVSGLRGNGQLTILDGRINGFSLGAAHAAAVSAQKENADGVNEQQLRDMVAGQLDTSDMAFTQIKAPFTVNNGILEFDKIALSDADGRVIIATFVQLANMQVDSEWALQSAAGIDGSKPRVSIVFSGPIENMGRLEPEIDTTGLARFVTIRKMQKDVERLEKLDVSGRKPDASAPPPQDQLPPSPQKEDAPPAAQSAANEPPQPGGDQPPPGPAPPLPKRKQVQAKPKPESAAAPDLQAPALERKKVEAKPEAAPVAVAEKPAPMPERKHVETGREKKPDTAPDSDKRADRPAAAPPPVQPVIPGVTPAEEQKTTTPAEKPAQEQNKEKEAASTAADAPAPAQKPETPVAAPQASVAAASAADAPVKLAPLPVRKPPVPVVKRQPLSSEAPAAAAAPRAADPAPLPWLQNTTPAPGSGQVPSDAQAPTQLPAPQAQDQPQQQPQPQPQPSNRFNPFSGNF